MNTQNNNDSNSLIVQANITGLDFVNKTATGLTSDGQNIVFLIRPNRGVETVRTLNGEPRLGKFMKKYDLLSQPDQVLGTKILVELNITSHKKPFAEAFCPYYPRGLSVVGQTQEVHRENLKDEVPRKVNPFIRILNHNGGHAWNGPLSQLMLISSFGPGHVFQVRRKNRKKQKGFEWVTIEDPRKNNGKEIK